MSDDLIKCIYTGHGLELCSDAEYLVTYYELGHKGTLKLVSTFLGVEIPRREQLYDVLRFQVNETEGVYTYTVRADDVLSAQPVRGPVRELPSPEDTDGRYIETDPKGALINDATSVPDPRNTNLGGSNYSTYNIQPWDIWEEYNLNPWDADIVKRVLRTKDDGSMTPEEQRILDYQKIIHICEKRISMIRG